MLLRRQKLLQSPDLRAVNRADGEGDAGSVGGDVEIAQSSTLRPMLSAAPPVAGTRINS
jgi:hypothetical protein